MFEHICNQLIIVESVYDPFNLVDKLNEFQTIFRQDKGVQNQKDSAQVLINKAFSSYLENNCFFKIEGDRIDVEKHTLVDRFVFTTILDL